MLGAAENNFGLEANPRLLLHKARWSLYRSMIERARALFARGPAELVEHADEDRCGPVGSVPSLLKPAPSEGWPSGLRQRS
jgi:hypothetical protein